MENLKIYEIENAYIDYLVPYAPHLFHNKVEQVHKHYQGKKQVTGPFRQDVGKGRFPVNTGTFKNPFLLLYFSYGRKYFAKNP